MSLCYGGGRFEPSKGRDGGGGGEGSWRHRRKSVRENSDSEMVIEGNGLLPCCFCCAKLTAGCVYVCVCACVCVRRWLWLSEIGKRRGHFWNKRTQDEDGRAAAERERTLRGRWWRHTDGSKERRMQFGSLLIMGYISCIKHFEIEVLDYCQCALFQLQLSVQGLFFTRGRRWITKTSKQTKKNPNSLISAPSLHHCGWCWDESAFGPVQKGLTVSALRCRSLGQCQIVALLLLLRLVLHFHCRWLLLFWGSA